VTFIARARVLYDDGTDDICIASGTTAALGAIESTVFAPPARADGYVIELVVLDQAGTTSGVTRGTTQFQAFITDGVGPLLNSVQMVMSDYLHGLNAPTLGVFRDYDGSALDIIPDTSQIAGNAGISGLGAVPAAWPGRAVVELYGMVYSYVCNSTVATRTTIAVTFSGLNDVYATGFATSGALYSSATLSLTASQDGAVGLEAGGTEFKNQNGTLTFAATKLWLPWKASTTGLSITITAATNGVAGDGHRAALLGRWVA